MVTKLNDFIKTQIKKEENQNWIFIKKTQITIKSNKLNQND